MGVAYDSDVEKAIELILNEFEQFGDLISNEAKPQAGIKEFGDSSVNLEYRYWTKTENYFETQYKVNLAIFNTLKANSIEIPFPIRNVYLHNES